MANILQIDCNDDSDEANYFELIRKLGIGIYDQGDCSLNSQEDASIPPLQIIQKYAYSENVCDRKMVARKVQDLLRTVPAQTLVKDMPEIMRILTELSNDHIVTADLLEQVPLIAAKATEHSADCSELKSIVNDYLITLVVKNIDNTKSVIPALTQLIEQGFINKTQVEIRICPTILSLSRSELNAAASVELMCKLAPLLGRDVTERVFLKRFTELCANEQFIVRKVCCLHIGDICSVVGKDSFENILLPSYIKLCSDETWSVRKSGAEVIMFVSCACTPETRKAVLSPIIIKLLQDESRWVKSSAFHALGPFISTFANPTVTRATYNNVGQLVLVNKDGSEYLMDTCNRDISTDTPFNNDFLEDDNDMSDCDKKPLKNIIQPSSEDQAIPAGLSDLLSNSPSIFSLPSISEKELNDLIDQSIPVTDDFLLDVDKSTSDCLEQPLYLNKKKTKTKNLNTNETNDDIKQCDNLDSSIETLNGNVKTVNSNGTLGNETDVNKNIESTENSNIPHTKPEPVVDNAETDQKTLKDMYSKFNLNDILEDSTTTEDGNLSNSNGETSDDSKESTPPPLVEKKPEQTIVPQELVDYFVRMTDQNMVMCLDQALTSHCAYSLPAVALTLGTDNWKLLKKTVEILATDMHYKVRKIVASSLHELAVILGPEIATQDLAPLFDSFIKDVDVVRIGMLKHLVEFFAVISPEKRASYLPKLSEFMSTDNVANWRFKDELGIQLQQAVKLFQPNDTANYIGKIAQCLLSDKVAAVRQTAIQLIIEIINSTKSEPGLTPHLLIKLAERFAHSKIWKRRQSYALLCSDLLANKTIPEEQFASEVMPHLLDLSWDPVANIRLVVARSLSNYIINNEYFINPKNEHLDGLESVLKRLQADKDRDVRESAIVEHTTVPVH
ncbi:serine/threonine-protein phosphatase 4 regulatory subunit 1-like isoform X3 [Aethina tumida]|uniref:serine/threonine-protein phosphatase 4 regulatory subunit 1-like isoform X3 n=1 Tax=Aethina tumida TaxID=116153 RepID=UPI002148F35E|nr:serine/threonine-protein phosphatase 4 regulatory subunit 1-like isoform X3 [Aethina tumida]